MCLTIELMGAIGHDPLKYIEGGGLIPIGHVLITCPSSFQHCDLFPNRFGISHIREFGVLAIYALTRITFRELGVLAVLRCDSYDLLDRISPSRTNFSSLATLCLCELRGRKTFYVSHDLCTNPEVGCHFPSCTTSERIREVGRHLSVPHDLCANSEVGRYFPPCKTFESRASFFRLARPLCELGG